MKPSVRRACRSEWRWGALRGLLLDEARAAHPHTRDDAAHAAARTAPLIAKELGGRQGLGLGGDARGRPADLGGETFVAEREPAVLAERLGDGVVDRLGDRWQRRGLRRLARTRPLFLLPELGARRQQRIDAREEPRDVLLAEPDDRARVVTAIEHAVAGKIDYRVEHRVLWPDGSTHWLEGKGSVHRDSSGKALTMTGTVVEITSRKRAEEEVLASEERLRHFVRHTPAAVAMFDKAMRYIYVADRWLTDYHLEGQAILGRSHYDVFPDIPERWKEIHRRALAGSVERCDEDPFERADGSTEWLQWEVRPWRKAGGEIGGVIMFTHVITARKRAEQAHRRYQGSVQRTTAVSDWRARWVGSFSIATPDRSNTGWR